MLLWNLSLRGFSSPNSVLLLNNHQHFTPCSCLPELLLLSANIRIMEGQKRAFSSKIVKNIEDILLIISTCSNVSVRLWMQSFVVCTASSTTLLLGKCDFHKISDSFHIFICNGVCHHYCKTQVLCQHVEWERDLLLLPAQPLDWNAVWTRILTFHKLFL